MNFLDGKKLHFIGVGGVSMSALLLYSSKCGASVSGSDARWSDNMTKLSNKSVFVYQGENPSVVEDVDIVIHSSAIKEENLELSKARELGKQIFERHEFLGLVAKQFDKVIAVAGTHGKTTVTAMIVHILKELDANFVGMVGGEVIPYGNYIDNSNDDKNSIFVTEACEYKRSLLSLQPTVGIVTNIECDHPDCYKDYEDIKNVFVQFSNQSQEVVVLYDDKEHFQNSSALIGNVTFNIEQESFCTISKIYTCQYNKNKDLINILQNGEIVSSLKINQKGDYNVSNALFAIATVARFGYDIKDICFALGSFQGIKRRFEEVGEYCGAKVVFDFAHHPTEIECSLKVARDYGKVLCVFQPHTYTRTLRYFDDFVKTLGKNDTLVVMKTYGAREKSSLGTNSKALASAISTTYRGCEVFLTASNATTVALVKSLAKSYDIIMFVGAGDIYELKKQFVNYNNF